MMSMRSSIVVLVLAAAAQAGAATITYDHTMANYADWSSFSNVPALSSTDYLGTLTDVFTAVEGSTCHSAGAPLTTSGLAVLNNGAGSTSNDQTLLIGTDGTSASFARLLIDLKASVNVAQFNSYGMIGIDGTRNYQRYDLYGSNESTAPTATGNPADNGWTLIANVATDNAWTPTPDDNHQTTGVSVSNINANYRYLLFDAHVQDVGGQSAYNGNHYVELDVVVPEPGTMLLLFSGVAGLLAYAWRKRR